MSRFRTFRRSIEGWVGATALNGFRWYLRRLPPERVEQVGEGLGRWIHRLSKRYRNRALSNLAMAYPEMPAREREDLARRVFEHYGCVTADFLVADRRSVEELQASMTLEGEHHFAEAFAKGKGVIFVTGHFGNWERMSSLVSSRGYPVTVVARDTHNPRINALLHELRSENGTRVIPRGNAARPIIERLRQNEVVGILPDQNSDEVFIPFFGQPAGTVLGPGVIAERTGAAVLLAACVRTGPGQYRMTVEPINAEPGYEAKGEGMTVAIHAALERVIRRNPEQWLWFHDRWKSARQRGLLKLPDASEPPA